MQEFDVAAFVAKLDHMGLKLSTIPLADGKLRVNRWRTLKAAEHTQQIQDLWATHIGSNQERMDLLAAHLADAQRAAIQFDSKAIANRITAMRPPVAGATGPTHAAKQAG